MHRKLTLTCLLVLLLSPVLSASLAPGTHPMFDGDAVHEIHLTFYDSNWYDLCAYNYEHYDDIPYIAAQFDWEDVHFDSIGVRFKGLSSYSYPGVKKPFKLDIDEYVEGQTVYGLDKLNLNNCYSDPSFVREICAYELCEALGLATVRTNYANLYINGTLWGVYVLVEQFDQEMIESRYGESEEGNLWKGDDHGSLEYLGTNQSSYYSSYELKTNEEENDWSDLIEFCDVLNNTSLAMLPDTMHNIVDVNSAMAMLAIDNFTVNLDSYVGRCANYYVYHRDVDDRMVFAKWDLNMAWGVYNDGMTSTQLKQLSPYYYNQQFGQERPLAERFYQISAYDYLYLGHMKKLMAGPAYPDTLFARMEELRDLVRPYVYADPNCMYTTTQFENAMTTDIGGGPGGGGGMAAPGLQPFIQARHTYLTNLIGSWTRIDGLVINELMASNNTTASDEFGDFDDWIEVANISESAISLNGLGLTDHWEGSPDYVFPDTTLQPGEYIVVWADEEPGEGSLHAPFKLDGDGEEVFLIDDDVVVDQVTFPALASDVSWGRWANGTGAWQLMSVATPGAENQNSSNPETVVLYINEFLALNDSVIMDETDTYEDWVEIYNPGPDPVDMLGLFLTDDLTNTTQWSFPDTTLEAGGFMLVWCDNDEEDGPLHTNFKLSGDGEEIGLFGRLASGNELIDSYTFGVQTTDTSEGRSTDGGATWVFFDTPTPGASNTASETVTLYINEFLADNASINMDETSSYEDWVEIYNPGPDPVNMLGLYLTDDLTNTTQWSFPDTTLEAGGFMLVWCDDDEEDGPLHTNFKLGASGEAIGLFGRLASGNELIDSYTFGAQTTDISEGRLPDGSSNWIFFDTPTPGASNVVSETVTLYINEFLADNASINMDETSSYEDWVEIYNPGPNAVDMSGLYLTDDLANTTQWSFPDTTLEAGGFMLVWCDNDEEDGPLHANFKLGASGESIGIFGRLTAGNELIDSYTFGAQTTDTSEGRLPDGSSNWVFFGTPTPGASNVVPETITLYINEFLADNDGVNMDETSSYEDWVEIYNPGPNAVDMTGLFLTDDLANTTQWPFPDTTLEAGGFMLVWCDDDSEDGPLHANFKLGASGEAIGLFGRLTAGNEVIDSYTFGAQTTDTSEGRWPDGGSSWIFFDTPTPGASNVVIGDDCCLNRADINHSGGAPDIADLVYLVTYMFQSGPAPLCDDPDGVVCIDHYYAEADINGDGGCDPDISDLVYLVSYMFSSGPAPVACP
ncbi:MAG TPA: lamin tail domain-containing protein [candidate division Zixibacteria bacterium]|nr:lamin tail domain-containing protein [candidate division Zixibacteria bacterium]